MEKQEFSISFSKYLDFKSKHIKPLIGVCGLYFIFLQKTQIPYPFKSSKLIYIGMSEKTTNSIGKRLIDHFEGVSGNEGISNYKKTEGLLFTHLNFEILKNIWQYRIEDLESYFILDFVSKYGVYPICNNKTGFLVNDFDLAIKLNIDWKYFD